MEVEKISIIVDFWTQIKDMVMGKQVCFYVFIFIITLIGGCDQSVEKGILDRYETFEMYADSVFLGFEGDLCYPEISWGNVDVYLSAFDRMKAHLKVKDDRLTWDFRRGADLNISENIYEYVIGVWQRQNEKLDSGEYRLELVGDNYTIEPIVQKDILSSRTGQFIIPGSHAYNMELLHNLYQLHNSVSLGGRYLGAYIENICDPSTFRPGYGYSSKNWSYHCDNGCYYDNNPNCFCIHNQISHPDSDLRGNEYWEKILNINNLPLVSIMNYNNFKNQ